MSGNIPGCTYCRPQIASVGLTEARAKEAGHEVKVGRFPFIGNGKAIAMGETEGMVKTVFDAKTGELLGAHMIGAEVTEMIQGYTIARTLEIDRSRTDAHGVPAPHHQRNDARGGAGGLRPGYCTSEVGRRNRSRSRPPSAVVRGPPSAVFRGPSSPVFREPPSPVIREPPSPVFREPPSPVIREPPSPVFREPPSPVIREPPSPVIRGPPSPVILGLDPRIDLHQYQGACLAPPRARVEPGQDGE